jgi:hypothetical protein
MEIILSVYIPNDFTYAQPNLLKVGFEFLSLAVHDALEENLQNLPVV